MGIINQFFRKLFGSSNNSSDKESSDVKIKEEYIYYDEKKYFSQFKTSENGKWRVAYGNTMNDNRVFLFKEDQFVFSKTLKNVGTLEGKADVSNNGTFSILDNLENKELSGKLLVFNSSGEKMFSESFDSNVESCAITRKGDIVAACTLNPDCSTYIFDIDNQEKMVEHKNKEGNVMKINFVENNDKKNLQLFDELDGDPVYSIDMEGKIFSKSRDMKRKEKLEDLKRSNNPEDIEEAIEIIEKDYNSVTDDNEKKNLAKELAETSWNLSKEINKDKYEDKWWQLLNKSKMFYIEILPWYDGKKGVAKVTRKQAKYHLKEGNKETALKLLNNIKDLEDKYEVNLLTKSDKEKIERLSKK